MNKNIMSTQLQKLCQTKQKMVVRLNSMEERLAKRRFAMTEEQEMNLRTRMEQMALQLADLNDEIYDCKVRELRKRRASIKVSYPVVQEVKTESGLALEKKRKRMDSSWGLAA